MTQLEIMEGLKDVLHIVRPKLNTDNVTLDSILVSELGIDSLSMMLIALASEEKFKLTFDNKTPFVTVGDVCAYIESKLQ